MKHETESTIRVVVNRSTEAIDFDAWAARYVRTVIAIDQAQQHRRLAPKEAA